MLNSKLRGVHLNIKIKYAKKRYDGKIVLDVENVDIKSNNIYAVVGMNGSGKSTLINGMAGVEEFSECSITYDGKQFEEVKDNISLMLQNFYIFNDTVRNNILLPVKYSKKKIDFQKNLEKYMKFFNLEPLLDKNARKLSGGEKTKTALLRALIRNTDLVILDEPTNNMDVDGIKAVEELIMYLKEEGKTVILITHNIMQVERTADYVLFIDKGRVVECVERKNIKNIFDNLSLKEILKVL